MAKKEISVDGLVYTISYDCLNLQHENVIVFLHGWGSNKALMKQAFGQTLGHYRHVYIDMPGFGQSSIIKPLNTQDYALIVNLFLESLAIQPYAIFGHSFGGKVAALLAPKRMILLSSAGIVIPKSFKVKAKIAFFKTFKPLMPKQFYRFFASKDVEGMSWIMYETLKKVVNEDFEAIFRASKAQTAIFWGIDDRATPLWSGEKIHHLIQNSTFYPLQGDHFFFLGQSKAIEATLMDLGY